MYNTYVIYFQIRVLWVFLEEKTEWPPFPHRSAESRLHSHFSTQRSRILDTLFYIHVHFHTGGSSQGISVTFRQISTKFSERGRTSSFTDYVSCSSSRTSDVFSLFMTMHLLSLPVSFSSTQIGPLNPRTSSLAIRISFDKRRKWSRGILNFWSREKLVFDTFLQDLMNL